MTFEPARTLRRLSHPILMRFWLERGTRRISRFRADSLDMRVLPTVFHPKYFGSSLIFARFIESLDLQGARFLDMGTGSGIIGLYAARAGAEVTSVDINSAAVACAEQNAASAGLKMTVLQSDLFDRLSDQRFDVIAWNPPFFPKNPIDLAQAAFYAGEGYATIRRFAVEARDHLIEGGRMYFIFSEDGGIANVQNIFREAGFSVRIVKSAIWGLAEKMVVLEVR